MSKTKTFIIRSIAMMLAIIAVLPASAVTKEEFEHARTIAATAYIRYTDDGSGYLDGKSPKSMSELESLVRPHAKDVKLFNEFKSKPTATDYSGWTKEDLRTYWSSTFFKDNSDLSSNAASSRRAKIQAGIGAMQVSAPAPVKEEKAEPADTVKEEPAQEVPEELTTPQEVVAEEVITDSVAADSEPVETAESSKSGSSWIYVIILIILIAIVIVLVVFAVKTMKKPEKEQVAADENEIRPQPVINRRKEVDTRHNEEMAAMQSEIDRLRGELARKNERQQTSQPQPVAPKEDTLEYDEEDIPVRRERTIYLGRANNDKIFVRADKDFTPGKSIYRLVTSNGLTGTYYVATQPAATELIASDPHFMLGNGAEVATFLTASGMTTVVTDSPGTAIFEDRCWKVLRPAAIHFE